MDFTAHAQRIQDSARLKELLVATLTQKRMDAEYDSFEDASNSTRALVTLAICAFILAKHSSNYNNARKPRFGSSK